jgi:hypothetical protein
MLSLGRQEPSLPTKGRMYELHPVAFIDRHRRKILSVNEAAIDFHDNRGIILLGAVKEVLDGNFTPLELFREAVEYNFQFRHLSCRRRPPPHYQLPERPSQTESAKK